MKEIIGPTIKVLNYTHSSSKRVRLHSGDYSHVIIDVIEMLQDPKNREALVYSFMNIISDHFEDPDDIYDLPALSTPLIGIETGGALVSLLLADKLKMPWGMVRKDKTLYLPETEQKEVFLIDDVCTTGTSIAEATKLLNKKGYVVKESYVVVDRSVLDI